MFKVVHFLQWWTRVSGVLGLVLGVLTERFSYDWLVRSHTSLGCVVAGVLAVLAGIGLYKRIPVGLTLAGLLWAGATTYLGFQQTTMMVSGDHWIIEMIHVVLGVGAMGLADVIGARLKRLAEPPTTNQENHNPEN
jgi:hypothetical protein